jgi:cell volume regulation protein A
MDFVNVPLLAAASLVFLSVLAGLFSARIGLSFLLVFLLAGVLAGEDGPGGYRFDDYRLSFWVGNLALAIILLDGGLRTAFSTFRTGLRPASLLATLGVVVCAAITAAAGMLFLGLDLGQAMLLGAIVGSTDAAAVFSLLTRSGVTLNERVAATLEIESGVNDPMAVYLTLTFIVLLAGTGATANTDGVSWLTIVGSFAEQFGWGALIGICSGFAMALLLTHVAARDVGGGILALLIGAAGLSVFAATGWLGGSGFLSVYLFGVIVANRAAAAVAPTLAAMDGYAWLAQAGMFLLLGLLVTPSKLVTIWLPGLAVAAVLILVARPAAVWICLWPFRFSRQEIWFISWVGLRGAVPIVLALFPLLAGVPQADVLFNVAFVVVLVSLLMQGTTVGWVARKLGVALPDPGNEQAVRAVFRDFALDPALPVGQVCDFYGLPAPSQAELPLAEWIANSLRRPPVAGDSVLLGSATLVVREVHEGRICAIGLGLPK